MIFLGDPLINRIGMPWKNLPLHMLKFSQDYHLSTFQKQTNWMLLFRLGFDIFNIAQPDTNVYTANCAAGQSCLTNSRTQCQRAQFMASQDGPAAPTICGTNTGYHMILEAEDGCNVLTFTWDSDSTREWNIHISQILCSDPHKPPQGCLQYFTGTTGNIASYNFQGGTHLANQVNYCCFPSKFLILTFPALQ